MWTVAAYNIVPLAVAALIGLVAAWWRARGTLAAGRGGSDPSA